MWQWAERASSDDNTLPIILCLCVIRRKKKCIRYSVGEEDVKDVGCEVGVAEDEEDDAVDLHHGNSDMVTTATTASSVLLSDTPERAGHHSNHHGNKLPRLLGHDVSVTLQTIPT